MAIVLIRKCTVELYKLFAINIKNIQADEFKYYIDLNITKAKFLDEI